jgi:hypothetical protein
MQQQELLVLPLLSLFAFQRNALFLAELLEQIRLAHAVYANDTHSI